MVSSVTVSLWRLIGIIVLLNLLHEVGRRAYREIDLPTKCALEVHVGTNVYEIVPAEATARKRAMSTSLSGRAVPLA